MIKELLQIMHKTVDLGVQSVDNGAGVLSMQGFDPLVNQRLLPPTFPRYTKVKSRVDALDYLEELLVRLKVASRITAVPSFHSALVSYLITLGSTTTLPVAKWGKHTIIWVISL